MIILIGYNVGDVSEIKLTERQQKILEFVIHDSTISAKVISEKISEKTSEKTSEKDSITDRTIETDIAKLKKLGVLIRKGGRKDGEWILTDLGLAVLKQTGRDAK